VVCFVSSSRILSKVVSGVYTISDISSSFAVECCWTVGSLARFSTSAFSSFITSCLSIVGCLVCSSLFVGIVSIAVSYVVCFVSSSRVLSKVVSGVYTISDISSSIGSFEYSSSLASLCCALLGLSKVIGPFCDSWPLGILLFALTFMTPEISTWAYSFKLVSCFSSAALFLRCVVLLSCPCWWSFLWRELIIKWVCSLSVWRLFVVSSIVLPHVTLMISTS